MKPKRMTIYDGHLTPKNSALICLANGCVTAIVCVAIPFLYYDEQISLIGLISVVIMSIFLSLWVYFSQRAVARAITFLMTASLMPWWSLYLSFGALCFYPFAWWKVVAFLVIAVFILWEVAREVKAVNCEAMKKTMKRKKAIREKDGKYYFYNTDFQKDSKEPKIRDRVEYVFATIVICFGPALYALGFALGKGGEVDARYLLAGSIFLVIAWGGRKFTATHFWVVKYILDQERALAKNEDSAP